MLNLLLVVTLGYLSNSWASCWDFSPTYEHYC